MSREEYIRASEIGSYLFCERAWSYGRQGVRPTAEVQASREAGIAFHRTHGTSVVRSRRLMFVGLILLFLALISFFVVRALSH
jgi:hypothetical protein